MLNTSSTLITYNNVTTNEFILTEITALPGGNSNALQYKDVAIISLVVKQHCLV